MDPQKANTGVGRFIDYANNTIYEGQIRKGKPHGFGRRIFKDGSYYSGLFRHGQVHGFGTLHNKHDKIEEQGYWKNGVLQAVEGVAGGDHEGHRHHMEEFGGNEIDTALRKKREGIEGHEH